MTQAKVKRNEERHQLYEKKRKATEETSKQEKACRSLHYMNALNADDVQGRLGRPRSRLRCCGSNNARNTNFKFKNNPNSPGDMFPKIPMKNSTEIYESYTPTEIIIVTLFTIIFVIGTIGNIFVFFYFGIKLKPAFSTYPSRIPDFLFCLLAIVDFVASVFNPFLYVYWTITRYKWYLGYWACKLLVPIGTIATTMSIGIYVILSFDRQRVILYPFKRHFKFTYIKLSVFFVLIYALIANTHYALNLTTNVKSSSCNVPHPTKNAYKIPSFLYFFFNAFTLLAVVNFTNYRIFSKMLNYSPTSTLALGGGGVTSRKKVNNRIVRLLVTLTLVFFLLTLPRDIFQFVYLISLVIGRGFNISKSMLTLNSFLKVMNVAHSSVNPIIYYWMHLGFKRFIRQSFGLKRISRIRRRTSDLNGTERILMSSLSK
ncbi:type-1 angiotensin II receptor [Hydra vulgaris]|uniref:type-1 angiotensin II receptor n=1 Tax=Hydra vulgaris TaxID=6087 RepID=UPI001F5F9602|nr:type-1 angiotensin II receptor-like [Hydra vulgaris]